MRARKYERTEGRKDTRAGSYTRQLHTKAGEVRLQVTKLRSLPFETAIIERYRRRESSVEEALIEMYLAGVSMRRVEDITQALWGTRVGASTVSDLNQRIYGKIEEWRQQPLVGEFPYVFLDGLWLKRSWGGEVKNVSVLVAIGVSQTGYREVLAVSEGANQTLPADEPARRSRRHRLTFYSGRMGSGANQPQTNNLQKSQPRSKVRKTLDTTDFEFGTKLRGKTEADCPVLLACRCVI